MIPRYFNKRKTVLRVAMALLALSIPFIIFLSHQYLFIKQHAATNSLLPGQHIWNNGVSSFLFGTNDTIRWSQVNAGNDPSIPQALKAAHFQLIRTWFFVSIYGKAQADAHIDNRMQVVSNSGAQSLCVLPDYTDITYNKHVVSYLGKRCNLYEFGNEPDGNMPEYIHAWNTEIPQLRRLNPLAKFIGPAVANHNNIQVFLSGVRDSGVLPDAISFHRYSCSGVTSSRACLSKVSSDLTQVIGLVRGWVQNALGRTVPLGITEYNYDSTNPPASYGTNPAFITQYTDLAINAMIRSRLDFANQFDLANGAGEGDLDMFDVDHTNGQPKPQYFALKTLIGKYIAT